MADYVYKVCNDQESPGSWVFSRCWRGTATATENNPDVGFDRIMCRRRRTRGWVPRCASEGEIGFFAGAGGDSFDGGGEEIVVVGDGQGEAGFDGGKLGQHVDLSIDGSMRGVLFIRRSTLYSFHASMPHANGAFSLKILASSAYLDGGYLLGFE